MYGQFEQNFGGITPVGFQNNVNQIKYTQTLTPEQIATLRQKSDKFSLGLTQEDVWRGICFHRDDKGTTLRQNPDGTTTCTICGYTFDPSQDMSEEDVQMAVNGIIDIMQTIKLLYLDMPEQPAKEYFQIIPLLEKAPKLYKLASDNFARHEQWNNFRFNGTPNTINLYNMLNSGMAPNFMQQPMGGMGMPQMGMMNNGMMNNGMAMQPNMMNGMMNNGMGMGVTGVTGQAIMPGSNGIMNSNINSQYQSGTPQGFQYTVPQMNLAMTSADTTPPQGAVQPAATSTTPTPDGKVEVTSTFKS